MSPKIQILQKTIRTDHLPNVCYDGRYEGGDFSLVFCSVITIEFVESVLPVGVQVCPDSKSMKPSFLPKIDLNILQSRISS